MDDTYFKKITTMGVLIVLIILSFFIITPIFNAILLGLILAFSLYPVYNYLNKKTNSKNFSGVLICVILLIAVLILLWFFTPIMVEQSLKSYYSVQEIDFVKPLKSIFPSLLASEQFSHEVGQIIASFVRQTTNSIANYFSSIILTFPTLLLQMMMALFIMFFTLRDKDKLISYIKSLLPFSKEVEEKLFSQTSGITNSILYGQFLLGIIQGIFVGISFFILGVPNATLLTLFACLAGIFPMVGTTIIWIPVSIYLFVVGDVFSGVGIILFGLVASFIDNILKPIFVASRTSLPSSLVLVGMIGGYLFMGILGVIIGPLILAYLLIVLEVYRNKKIPGILIQEKPQKFSLSI